MLKKVECTIPVLPVKDLKNSITFYTESLGFQVDWGGEDGKLVCSVSRDACSIMLSTMHGAKQSTWVWIGVKDDSLFHEYTQKGVKVIQKPTNQPWAYEMRIEDIDGNILWLGAGPRTDIAFHNEPNS